MTVPSGAPLPSDDLSALRVPKALRGDVTEIVTLIDAVCSGHLDDEYSKLCRRLLGSWPASDRLHWYAGNGASGPRVSSTPWAASTSCSTRARNRTSGPTSWPSSPEWRRGGPTSGHRGAGPDGPSFESQRTFALSSNGGLSLGSVPLTTSSKPGTNPVLR